MPRIKPTPLKGKPWATQDHTLKGPWFFRSKEKVICVCEGGNFCWRENPAKQSGGNAIPGLHCNWVGDQKSILAMARPWQQNVVKYNLPDAFMQNNVGMILNLQEVGEHASCGPGNLPHCGFTYDPESFMAARISVFNFSWRDMGVPDMDKMMDIVQVMEHVIQVEGRKVAVHCHAGLGRTGLAIACSLVFSHDYTARRAVTEVRRDRPGALQTRKQEMFVYIFEQYLAHLRCLHQPHGLPQPGDDCQDIMPQNAAAAQQQQPAAVPTTGQDEMSTGSEKFPYGLSITYPSWRHSDTSAAQPEAAGKHGKHKKEKKQDRISRSDLGLDHHLPWTDQFDIRPEKYNKAWLPHPPRTYEEALKRQLRLIHGQTRRVYRHLHRYLAEAGLAIISAAGTYHSSPCPQGEQYLNLCSGRDPNHNSNTTYNHVSQPGSQAAVDCGTTSTQSTTCSGKPLTSPMVSTSAVACSGFSATNRAGPFPMNAQGTALMMSGLGNMSDMGQAASKLTTVNENSNAAFISASPGPAAIQLPGSMTNASSPLQPIKEQKFYSSQPVSNESRDPSTWTASLAVAEGYEECIMHSSMHSSFTVGGTIDLAARPPNDHKNVSSRLSQHRQLQTARLEHMTAASAAIGEAVEVVTVPPNTVQEAIQAALASTAQQTASGPSAPHQPHEPLLPPSMSYPAAGTLYQGAVLDTAAAVRSATQTLPSPLQAQQQQLQQQHFCFAEAVLQCCEGPTGWPAMMLQSVTCPVLRLVLGGPQANVTQLQALHKKLNASVDYGNIAMLHTSPIAIVMMAVEQVMSGFTQHSPALSERTLVLARDHHSDLPYTVQPGCEIQQLEAAQKVASSMPPSDQELVLLFAGVLRHVLHASRGSKVDGKRIRAAMLGLVDWVVALLLGRQVTELDSEGLYVCHRSMRCLLWYYMLNDVAFASLVLMRNQRQSGKRNKTDKPDAVTEQQAPFRDVTPSHEKDAGVSQAPTAAQAPAQPRQPVSVHQQPSATQLQARASKDVPPAAVPVVVAPSAVSQPRLVAPYPFPLPPAPLSSPPPYALSPAPAHEGPSYSPPQPPPPQVQAIRALPGALPSSSGGAALAPVALPSPDRRQSRLPELSRELSEAAKVALRQSSDTSAASFRAHLAAIPTAYIPPTTPGTQQTSVHDVWM